MHDLLDGGIDEVRVIRTDDIGHVIREALRIFFQLLLDRPQSFERIRIIGQREGEDRRLLSRRTGNEAVILCTKLDTGHILQTKHGAVIIGTKYDIAEFLLRHKTTLRRDDVLEGGILIDRSAGNVTGRDLLILRRNGRNDLARSDLVLRHLRRIHPDAHRKVRAEFLYVADALDGLQLIQVVHGEIVLQEYVIIRAIRREQADDKCHVPRRFPRGDADGADRIRKPCIRSRDAILYSDGRHIRVRPRQELDRERIGAIRVRCRRHIIKAFGTDDILFYDLGHRLRYDFRVSARIGRMDRDLRRRDLRIAVDRQ